MRFQGVCYRGHDPAWAWSPLSGAGAAAAGGRFNWQGMEALYLSLALGTAILEVTHGFAHRITPFTFCSYDVDCEDIADLRDEEARAAAGVTLAELGCNWGDFLRNGRTPPSHTAVRRLRESGLAGILVPSFANGASADDHNLVLWRYGPDLPHRVQVYDPSGRLPKNQLSWT
ncbi:MAG: RES family NAD+ phosphorylase [Parcubacteria group bacterium]